MTACANAGPVRNLLVSPNLPIPPPPPHPSTPHGYFHNIHQQQIGKNVAGQGSARHPARDRGDMRSCVISYRIVWLTSSAHMCMSVPVCVCVCEQIYLFSFISRAHFELRACVRACARLRAKGFRPVRPSGAGPRH